MQPQHLLINNSKPPGHDDSKAGEAIKVSDYDSYAFISINIRRGSCVTCGTLAEQQYILYAEAIWIHICRSHMDTSTYIPAGCCCCFNLPAS
jgi:hypothetical protein